jgi:type 1 fimbria pilin
MVNILLLNIFSLPRYFLFFFIFLSKNAMAILCFFPDGSSISNQWNKIVSLNLPRAITSDNKQIFMDLTLKCKRTLIYDYDDYLELKDVFTGLPSEFQTGIIIDGVDYPTTIKNKRIITFKPGQTDTKIVHVKFYFTMGEDPGHVFIPKGSIARIEYQFLGYAGTGLIGGVDFYPSNSVIYTSGSCKINGGRDINVDFGQVSKLFLSSNGATSKIFKSISVQYRCKNPLTTPIKIWLSADNSSFSPSAIKTSNENIGIETYYNGSLLKPGDSARTHLNSGIGFASLRFELVKSQFGELKTGPFKSSAVLVMSLD